MLAGGLERGHAGQQLALVDAAGGVGHDVGEPHLAVGEGAGLVEDHDIDGAREFEGIAPLEEDAELGAAAGSDQDRRRRRQTQRARTGDDQDRDRVAQGDGHLGLGEEPAGEGRRADCENHGDEDAGDPVDELLHRGLGGLRFLDELRDAGEGGLFSDARGLDHHASFLVERGAEDPVSRPLVHRKRLAGEHALVEGGASLHDGSVGGNLLARPDHQQITRQELLRGHGDLVAFSEHARLLFAELEQARDRLRGATPCARLQEAPGQDQGDDHGRRVEEDRLAHRQGPERVQVGGEGAQGDQGVHVGAEPAGALDGAAMELPAEDPLDHRRQCGLGDEPGRSSRAAHPQQQHRRAEERRQQRAPPRRRHLPLLSGDGALGKGARGAALDAVAEAAHRLLDRTRSRTRHRARAPRVPVRVRDSRRPGGLPAAS